MSYDANEYEVNGWPLLRTRNSDVSPHLRLPDKRHGHISDEIWCKVCLHGVKDTCLEMLKHEVDIIVVSQNIQRVESTYIGQKPEF